jgi:Ca2+-binding EF-hand superfamily protein
MLDRMARNNPKIDLTKPIPISVITESFQSMRAGGGPGGGGPWGGGGDSSEESVGGSSSNTLVPGFGVKISRSPVPGFGASGKNAPTKVEDQDLRDADERMRRYDRNNDGSIDETEYRETRWTEKLSQWDTNKDGKLTREEVAVRYARRRLLSSNQPSAPDQGRGGFDPRNRGDARGDNQGGGKNDGGQKSNTVAHPFEKRASFRVTDSSGNAPRPAGVPEWFARDDSNLDNQISMGEFARKWDASTLENFYSFDTNQDGFITLQECLAGVKKGYLKGSGGSSSSVASSDGSAPAPSAGQAPNPSAPSGNAPAVAVGGADSRMREFAKKAIDKADKDKNGFLTPDEFKSSGTTFADVDTDKNGKIDLDEYALFRAKR